MSINEETISWAQAHQQPVTPGEFRARQLGIETPKYLETLTESELRVVLGHRAALQLEMQLKCELDELLYRGPVEATADFSAERVDTFGKHLDPSEVRREMSRVHQLYRRRLGEEVWQVFASRSEEKRDAYVGEFNPPVCKKCGTNPELVQQIVASVPGPSSRELELALIFVAIESFDGVPPLDEVLTADTQYELVEVTNPGTEEEGSALDAVELPNGIPPLDGVEPLLAAGTLIAVREVTHQWAEEKGLALDSEFARVLLRAADRELIEAVQLPGLDFVPEWCGEE